ncbi:hypothetical protein PHYBLDRAFT_65619 [Phycomyces blakesleeanus NRRL 1555(-)]|uniref:Uncharacterized protein n=1 Tax=Phycomyces blakesleeanus (strain ATCC 8743b / DSM 1359 / FGSC 10004 / NBRC 33097 / NRRL 1555) TaxID=763407 RepID=A0A162U4T9_PHYB8|nr:hypothetical protein PHYBLDRAFT_65619 [Phycomyces blakesleeanus NRRL 1555(-)]OAD72333.1 hypothetical protein PHYBLDRAFT_65619 [Phycomyces blakesleeanus NRRL 1555(-)]|eukprot:XP_018290373.1 hypothetical protein PHYBLDRAFT_65619 [Phycomyces blakesleeanus NRRL 1555(-)]
MAVITREQTIYMFSCEEYTKKNVVELTKNAVFIKKKVWIAINYSDGSIFSSPLYLHFYVKFTPPCSCSQCKKPFQTPSINYILAISYTRDCIKNMIDSKDFTLRRECVRSLRKPKNWPLGHLQEAIIKYKALNYLMFIQYQRASVAVVF